MIPQKRKYFIILVHHGDPAPTDQLVKSLEKADEIPEKIILIDNSEEEYKSNSKLVTHIRSGENHGYAAGINMGLGALFSLKGDPEDIIVCLNNDIKISPRFLSEIKNWWEVNSHNGFISNKAGQLSLLTGRARIKSSLEKDGLASVSYLHGSMLAAPFSVFMSMQGFPEDFFLYWEDVAISNNAKARKIPLKVNADLSMHHNDQIRSSYTDEQIYYLVRNGATYLQSKTPRHWRVWWKALNRVRLAYHSISPQTGQTPIKKQALQDAIQQKTGKKA